MDLKPTSARALPAGPPLARGATADVYAWTDGYVLKLFHTFGLEDVEFEQRIARTVHASGLPVPGVGPILQVQGRHGLLYERVEGLNMLESLKRQPWRVVTYGRRLAELQAGMHKATFQTEMPAMRVRMERKIRAAKGLPAQIRDFALAELASMPVADRICHGDFHPMNVLLTARGEVVIDWIDATSGSPLADVARTSLLLLGAASTVQVPNPLAKALVRLFHTAYLRHYFTLCPGGEHEYRRWLPIVAAARLSEQIPEQENWLVAQAQRIKPVC